MCESGKQCCEGESCAARVDQLKKYIWALMIWVFILSLGLGASIALHFILHQRPDRTTPPANTDVRSKKQAQLTTYDPSTNRMSLLWQKSNGFQKNTAIRVEDDGNYFLFLRVTLETRRQGVNYTVTVKKMTQNKSLDDIIVGHINGMEISTGFMGRGVHLTENTLLNVTCSPPTQIDVRNTYLGLIRF